LESAVAQLKIKVTCKSMLISTAFFRFCKGVEHCYYALLFSSDPYAQMGAKPWLSWGEIGFHLAEREPPPEAAEADQLLVDARPGRNFKITASSSNAATLERVARLIHELDRIRGQLGAAQGEARFARIASDTAIESILLAPLRGSLNRNAVPADKTEAYMNMMHRGLLAICDPQVSSIETELEAAN